MFTLTDDELLRLPQVTLQIPASIWETVEQVFPFARHDREAALAYLLGLAVGVMIDRDELMEEPEEGE
jgi:hypothetical protein